MSTIPSSGTDKLERISGQASRQHWRKESKGRPGAGRRMARLKRLLPPWQAQPGGRKLTGRAYLREGAGKGPARALPQGSRMSLVGDDLEHIGVVPGGLLAPAA